VQAFETRYEFATTFASKQLTGVNARYTNKSRTKVGTSLVANGRRKDRGCTAICAVTVSRLLRYSLRPSLNSISSDHQCRSSGAVKCWWLESSMTDLLVALMHASKGHRRVNSESIAKDGKYRRQAKARAWSTLGHVGRETGNGWIDRRAERV